MISQWRKDSLFNRWCWYNQTSTYQKRNTNLTPLTKINSKWIIELSIKGKTIKLLANNIRENLDALGYSNNFLGIIPKALPIKEITDKLDFINIKNAYSL